MKKIFTFALLATISAVAVQAQKLTSKKLNWGFKTGINFSNLRVEDGDAYDWKTGLVVGAFFKIKGGDKFSIQPEFLYSSMGGKSTAINSETSLRLNYFSVPVLAKFEVRKRLAIVIGPQIDMLISAKTKNKSNNFMGVTDDYKEYSFNGTAGFDYWPSHCLGIGARYIYGFTDINAGTTSTSSTASQSLTNQGVQITAAIKL